VTAADLAAADFNDCVRGLESAAGQLIRLLDAQCSFNIRAGRDHFQIQPASVAGQGE